MSNLLSFFQKKPTTSVRLLTTFLQQCQTYGGHLVTFSARSGNDNGRKHRLNTLLKPLHLSRSDKKLLIKEYLNSLSTLTINPDDIFSAINHQDQQAFPCQVCDNCAPSLFKYYGYRLTDNGWCSQCHQQGDCLDIPLIEHYRKYGIDDDTIDRYLPRKRWGSRNTGIPPLYLSLKDIEKVHQTLFDAFEAKKRLAALRS
ncbi:hypothetical protein [Vibrio parahaemolyticus]|uniref:hypothetical protein n=1 Tax=Vibrio parahaemolyticus TaxID=670 RepID=UPI00215CCD1F|nr:hypothetical protein [Vibrio parahaemolyticus]MCR9819761.1 hypothetical protein [Vibrio parahaemolyticus]